MGKPNVTKFRLEKARPYRPTIGTMLSTTEKKIKFLNCLYSDWQCQFQLPRLEKQHSVNKQQQAIERWRAWQSKSLSLFSSFTNHLLLNIVYLIYIVLLLCCSLSIPLFPSLISSSNPISLRSPTYKNKRLLNGVGLQLTVAAPIE